MVPVCRPLSDHSVSPWRITKTLGVAMNSEAHLVLQAVLVQKRYSGVVLGMVGLRRNHMRGLPDCVASSTLDLRSTSTSTTILHYGFDLDRSVS